MGRDEEGGHLSMWRGATQSSTADMGADWRQRYGRVVRRRAGGFRKAFLPTESNASPTDRVAMCRISHLASVMMSACVRSAVLRRVALMMAHS
jgi:hypothetical protein